MVSNAQDQIHVNTTLAEKLGQEDKNRGQHMNTVCHSPPSCITLSILVQPDALIITLIISSSHSVGQHLLHDRPWNATEKGRKNPLTPESSYM